MILVMRNIFLLIVFVVFCVPIGVDAQTDESIRVIEETAILFTGFLSKADFDKRFPGQLFNGANELNSGWYVIYEHESISYYFGPMLLESVGRDYLAELRLVVDEAVDQRPTIEGYRLELSFEPQEPSSGREPNVPAESFPKQPNSSPQAPEPGIFNFFKRLFGFG